MSHVPATIPAVLRRPVVWALFYGLLFAFSVYAVWRIPVEVLPRFDYPQVSIIAHDPGATAEEMETLITRPLEGQLMGLSNLTTLRSAMSEGTVQITARFREGTSNTLDLQSVNGALGRAQAELPPGIQPYAEVMGNAINEVADYATRIPSSVSPVSVLTAIEANVVPALRALPGVQRVEVFGVGNDALWVQPDPLALRRYGLSLTDIEKVLRQQVVLGPAGYVTLGHQDVVIEMRHLPQHSKQLLSILIPCKGGSVPLGAIAHVIQAPIPVHSAVRLNGRSTVALIIFKQPGASTVPVMKEVEQSLNQLKTQLPEGVAWKRIYSQAHLVGLIGHDLGMDLIFGGLLAIVALFWVLGFQRSVWGLAFSIPASLLLGVAALYLFGQSLNLLTFGALSVGIGLLADDGVIVMESIYHCWEEGDGTAEGIWNGLRSIVSPDVSGTLTTVCVFLPLFLVSGLAGLFFSPFALAISLALLASLLISLTLLPLYMFAAGRHPTLGQGSGKAFLEWLHEGNRRLLDVTLKRPRWSLAVCVVLLVVSCAGMAFVPVNFLPLPNEGVLLDGFTLPPGSSLTETVRTVDKLSAKIRRDKDVADVFARIGSARDTAYTEPSSSGEIQVVLRQGVNPNHLDTIAARLTREMQFPGVLQSFDTPTIERVGESLSGLPQPFVVRIYGERLKVLRNLSEKVSQRLKTTGAMSDIFNNDGYPVTQLQIEPKMAAMSVYGISPANLMQQLDLGLFGQVVAQIPQGNTHLDLYLRFAKAHHLSVDALRQMLIRTGKGFTPLGQLATVSWVVMPNLVRHYDGARSIEVLATPTRSLSAAVRAAKQALSGLALPSGYRIAYGGLLHQLEGAGLQLLLAIILAIVLLLGILLIQFDNLRIPGILLLEMPLAFTGGALALWVSGVGMNATGFVGFITIIGISLNHGIVLLYRAVQNEKSGMAPAEAVREAVSVRFRPIVLTTLTAMLGMLPTALGLGRGAAPEQGLAIVIIGGVLWSSILSTNLIPALYLHWHSRRQNHPVTQG